LAWADRPHTKPVFLWAHFIDPHGPYTPPGFESKNSPAARALPVSKSNFDIDAIPAYQALPGRADPDEYVGRYNGEVDYTDAQVGRLLDGLRERGLTDGAYVLFSADHGESLGDHHRWFQHGSSLFEAQMHVPLMIRGPGIVPHEESVAISSIDVVPTFLELLSLPMSADLQGTSLRGLLAGGEGGAAAAAAIRQRLLFTELWDKRAVISGNWKLIWKVGESAAELYDVAKDPEELNDVALFHADVVKPMLAAISRFSRENTKDESPLDDEETRKTLKALGYVN
ncbi:MAG TPA: sulfatase-like hydrolase/transferase, partial [Verrucomicrobiae bacterium]|nr:sulfatase-like hydrolase/transferase [Verrucomicrobiae bacterium]